MLERVEIRSAQGALLTLSLDDISNGYVLEDIDGLDPTKANIISTPFAQTDGEQFQASRREKRNVTIQLVFAPDEANQTVQALRRNLYGYFMPKSKVKVRFFHDEAPFVADLDAIVEDFNSPKFVKEPFAHISLLSMESDFYAPEPTTLTGATTSTSVETKVVYDGSVETGFLFRLNVNRTLSEFTIHHRPADGSLRTLAFVAPIPLQAGDILEISTVTRNKFATLRRAGSSSSILFAISPQSSWINLFPGDNMLRVYAEGAAVPFQIEYTTKFGGL